ncbi:hypothetical protein Ait01nite_019810 [Actinoplanes italicus]|uniref:Uncharacterized protein n=1 Tax=Actinoplanes italicus TaxID=113567 RepID=A0A2T0KPG0_9ACTN|nr:hypothetical protein [Actinoplanes italicus]PRX25618.1 hypothetical protein CLV67_101335 [Actinoplanes italicus]GIE28936.1 hypothetical protein Ait01nite_019810 [Actinoplanes italicus]
MNQIWLIVVIPVVLSLLVNEFCDLSPWLAKKLIPRAARLWSLGDLDTAEILAEEWAAVIDDVPGKLTKLGQAVRFMGGATWRYQRWQLTTKYTQLLVGLSNFLSRVISWNEKKSAFFLNDLAEMRARSKNQGAVPAPDTVKAKVIIPLAVQVKGQGNVSAEAALFHGDPGQIPPIVSSNGDS